MNTLGMDVSTPAIVKPSAGTISYLVLMAAIIALWVVSINRPLDLPSWHEFDDAAIAKNFVQEPSGILLPRIDWRRDGPGFAESEFPLYPWLMSQMYRVGGFRLIYGRLLALLATIGSLSFFLLIARSVLPDTAAFTAVLIFGTNRIVNFVSTALQPEAFMFCFYLAAVYAFLQWRKNRSLIAYAGTIIATSLAILEKSPAAHLGILFLLVLFWEEGWKLVLSVWNWCLAFSLVLPALWYLHAHKLWLTYGNSLGISNEDHWVDLDALRHLALPAGLVIIETFSVFSIGAVLLAGLGVLCWRTKAVRFIFLWFASIAIYYLVTIRTTGALWAWYYHIVSVAPMALLCGFGAAYAITASSRIWNLVLGAVIATLSIWALLAAIHRMSSKIAALSLLSPLTVVQFLPLQNIALVVLCIALVVFLPRFRVQKDVKQPLNAFRASGILGAAGLSAYLFVSCHLIAGDVVTYSSPTPELLCAKEFRRLVPENALILTSGSICTDSLGHKTAFEAPYMFYWLDRKGFSMCRGEQSMATVASLSARGASYFVAEKSAVSAQPGFEAELKSHFALVSECNVAWLFDLRSGAVGR